MGRPLEGVEEDPSVDDDSPGQASDEAESEEPFYALEATPLRAVGVAHLRAVSFHQKKGRQRAAEVALRALQDAVLEEVLATLLACRALWDADAAPDASVQEREEAYLITVRLVLDVQEASYRLDGQRVLATRTIAADLFRERLTSDLLLYAASVAAQDASLETDIRKLVAQRVETLSPSRTGLDEPVLPR